MEANAKWSSKQPFKLLTSGFEPRRLYQSDCLHSSKVEQRPFKPLVAGSSPAGGTILPPIAQRPEQGAHNLQDVGSNPTWGTTIGAWVSG